jgi:hypothetical protein
MCAIEWLPAWRPQLGVALTVLDRMSGAKGRCQAQMTGKVVQDASQDQGIVLWCMDLIGTASAVHISLVAQISTILGSAIPDERAHNGWIEGVAIWIAVFVVIGVGACCACSYVWLNEFDGRKQDFQRRRFCIDAGLRRSVSWCCFLQQGATCSLAVWHSPPRM